MASKSRGGLSKREYAAKQATLTQPKTQPKITSNRSTAANHPDASNPLFNPANFAQNQSKPFSFNDSAFGKAIGAGQTSSNVFNNSAFGKAVNTPKPSNSSSSSKSKSKSKSGGSSEDYSYSEPTSNRSKAQSIFNNLTGTNTAQAASRPEQSGLVTPTVKQNTSGLIGSLFNGLVEPVKGIYHNFTDHSMPDLGLSEKLGINKDIPGGLVYNRSDSPQRATIDGTDVTVNPSDPNSIFYSNNRQTPAPYRNWDTFNQSQGNDSSNRTDTRISRPNPTRPNPIISNSPLNLPNVAPDIFHVPSDGISSAYQSPEMPNGGSIQRENPSVRQFLGNGYLSSGTLGNGAGLADNNNLQGASTGVDEGNGIWDELKLALGGVPRAQAQEAPQVFSPNVFNNSAFGKAVSSPSPSNPLFNPANFAQNQMPSYSNGGAAGIGGQTKPQIQKSQTIKSSNQEADTTERDFLKQYFDKKYYDNQEKSNKKYYNQQEDSARKQIEDLVKSIENEYAQSQTEQTGELDKQKLADLQKLNSMFSYGNSEANDEQRIQYNQRTSADFGTKLTDLLAKLAQGKSKDILDAKNKGLDLLGQIGEKRQASKADLAKARQTAKSEAAKAWQEYQDKLWDRDYKLKDLASKKSGGEKNDSLTYLGNNSKGEPVYWNNRTKQQQVGTGLSKSNDLASLLGLMNGGQQNQGGDYFTGQYTEDGKEIWQDEQGQYTK